MKEKKNGVCAAIGETVTTKKNKSSVRGRKRRKEMAREICKQGHWTNTLQGSQKMTV